MGLDLYIEAKICEKKTGKIISAGAYEAYADEDDKGYFEICRWFGWDNRDTRAKMIEICNKHSGTNYTEQDETIPLPRSALREIYAHLVKRSYLPDDEYFHVSPCNKEWESRGSYEKMNLVNAEKLHDLLWILASIKYDNVIHIDEKLIPDKNNLKLLKDDPQAYEWYFRIVNSY